MSSIKAPGDDTPPGDRAKVRLVAALEGELQVKSRADLVLDDSNLRPITRDKRGGVDAGAVRVYVVPHHSGDIMVAIFDVMREVAHGVIIVRFAHVAMHHVHLH